jgi:hypothetical protein
VKHAFSSFLTFHDPNKTWKIWKEIFLEIAPLIGKEGLKVNVADG